VAGPGLRYQGDKLIRAETDIKMFATADQIASAVVMSAKHFATDPEEVVTHIGSSRVPLRARWYAIAALFDAFPEADRLAIARGCGSGAKAQWAHRSLGIIQSSAKWYAPGLVEAIAVELRARAEIPQESRENDQVCEEIAQAGARADARAIPSSPIRGTAALQKPGNLRDSSVRDPKPSRILQLAPDDLPAWPKSDKRRLYELLAEAAKNTALLEAKAKGEA
jgi:hypothetical protein